MCFMTSLHLDDYAFMGSLIIQEVVKELLTKGLDNAKVLLLAGSRSVRRVGVSVFTAAFFPPLSPNQFSSWSTVLFHHTP